jgi:hypothetical protein
VDLGEFKVVRSSRDEKRWRTNSFSTVAYAGRAYAAMRIAG